ncbi:MAG: hypothetical protein JSU57_05135 [Candidatus Heimdallarchaeota archaeon]|nr:MAG: hypothetical protein JSU57_05135 [Candidatus Heimdallarchaeota archaeon]
MDEKNSPKFEFTRDSRNPDEFIEDQSNSEPDKDKQKYPSFNFWSSRGNMGEKINLLICMNLLLIKLLSALVTAFRSDYVLNDEAITTLSMVEEFLSKILLQPETGLEIPEKIEKINIEVSSLLDELSSTSTSTEVLGKPSAIQEERIGLFQRNIDYQDKWGILDTIEKMFSSYSNLSHLGFPNYYFTACKELHRYELRPESSLPNPYEIFQIPSFEFKNLISKLLREAPAARLLQNLRRLFPGEDELSLTSLELEQVQDVVKKYYLSISEYSGDNRKLQDSLRVSSSILQNYNLGTGDLESRIPNVSFSVVKEIYLDLQKAVGNDFKQFICSETIIMINRLNNTMLENEKFVTFLRRLK